MIGRLRGQLLVKRPPHLLIEVNGVGYELEAPMSTIYDLPAVGETVTLVDPPGGPRGRPCALRLRPRGRSGSLRALLKVTGVGARSGLAVLRGSTRHVSRPVRGSTRTCTPSRGLPDGTKTAQRAVMEMEDRVAAIGAGAWGKVPVGKATAGGQTGEDGALTQAVDALIALGYKPAEANRMARAVDDGAKTSEIIRLALRAAASG